MKAAFYTLGCKLNYSETATISQEFLNKGFDIIPFEQPADVYVINTCTVTQNAEKDCRQTVRRALRQNPDALIVVTGCYAQLRAEEIGQIEGVDFVLGSNEKFRIFDYIKDFEKNELSCIHVSDSDDLENFYSASSSEADTRTRAFFKVQDGCDYKCSFCTIPKARGKSRSMNPSDAVSKFHSLIREGYKEVILTGVNVGDYGLNYDQDLYKLLKSLLQTPGDYRLRISSIEPNLLNDNLIALAADDERVCNHFHIPLQSGSDKILKLMRRRYNSSDYKRVIEKLNARIADVGIGVDIIVGFPGEDENDFENTYNFVNALDVSYFHVFTYSERPGTSALELGNVVDVGLRRKRNNMLRILSAKKRAAFYRGMKGKTLQTLFEENESNGRMTGWSSNYTRIRADHNPEMINNLIQVQISETDGEFCYAETSQIKNNFKLVVGQL
ncbi:MAG: tRNA (N(6)-L-threonylcarbamoyladenosine(37)-C(2))-methylthiotransferase MtaB [Ignavibacteriales bacterium]|nr:tRNA (N(6)-L-threonylcarbamoyladenosine(37)-C(2))-methylthiotransferase MtaB [Ignavibacteriales bacterium]MCF8305157.1 tRNA (N(6)-L-threonylcarbamoyladenosine(37)-C(2))-methylthiotransferase MtaB [Ignavibacteriales bacterium]MCF8314930.1 tRNA (N(6)-L-threonylcarbamoyladenosine(37)-C(2))-methylthiotransferase MtaB [Ignavibacteriales bacterium]MCF8436121.1 tRNA (N(6)-L-threonylcarbamoyladenosine(37)-C(2))-methylthiotransferase MtaB [Ignavibacteriales bacterium]